MNGDMILQKIVGLVFILMGILLIVVSGDGTASVFALWPLGLWSIFSKKILFHDEDEES